MLFLAVTTNVLHLNLFDHGLYAGSRVSDQPATHFHCAEPALILPSAHRLLGHLEPPCGLLGGHERWTPLTGQGEGFHK